MRIFRQTKIAVVFASICTLGASFTASAERPTDKIVFDGSNFDACLRSTSELSVVLPYERLRKFQGALRTFTSYQANGAKADPNETPYQQNDRVCKTMHGKKLPQIVAEAELALAIANRQTDIPVVADR